MSQPSMTTVVNANVESHSFKWTIVNFSKISEQFNCNSNRKDMPLKYDAIKIGSSEWNLIFPNDENNFILFSMSEDTLDPNIHQTNAKVLLIDSVGEIAYTSYMSSTSKVLLKIPSQSLFDEKEKYLPNDTLTVTIEFEVLYKYTVTNSEDEYASKLNKPNWKFSSDLLALLDTQTCSDVTLRCEDSEFPAHKAILSARSPVFSKIFKHDTLENKLNVFYIPDIKSSTMKELLHYIYGKEIVDLPPTDICFELYEAADKYQLLELKAYCASILVRNLSVDTVCDIALLANMHNDRNLFAAAKRFVKNNGCAAKLYISRTWIDFVLKSPDTASLLIAD